MILFLHLICRAFAFPHLPRHFLSSSFPPVLCLVFMFPEGVTFRGYFPCSLFSCKPLKWKFLWLRLQK